MNKNELILVVDFGAQYNQLILRRVREHNVFCEMIPYTTPLSEIISKKPIGIILTGGPSSVNEENSPKVDEKIFDLNIPILGICYGCQLIVALLKGKITEGPKEFGGIELNVNKSTLLDNVKEKSICWMSHNNYIEIIPGDFNTIAYTENCKVAALENTKKNIYGVLFHPEVTNTEEGSKVFDNFLFKICKAKGDWKTKNFTQGIIDKLKEKIKDKKVLCALSGGIDSAVTATLINRACKNLTCIYVDHGLMRKNETEEIIKEFRDVQKMNLVMIDGKERFLSKLKGVTDPEEKRKIIGKEFIKIFEEESLKIGSVDFLAQGTIYPDVIESGSKIGAKIKSHHNVGGLPDVVKFNEIIEPLRYLFKDEVRNCGYELGLPDNIVSRQPFPGPGLAIRIIGEITEKKIKILQEADFIYRDEISKAGLNNEIWQYFAVLTNIQTVGVMGDQRTYDYVCGLRAVYSSDGMTADFAKIPYDVLEKISSKIINEVEGINRVVYDVTSKPPATIEWE